MRNLSRWFVALLLGGFLPVCIQAQSITADFNTTPVAACAQASGCASFTKNISGTDFVFTLFSADAGGSMQWLASGGGVGGSGSMDILSGTAPNTATTEKVVITRQDGLSFNFNSIYIQNDLAEITTVQGYKNAALVGTAQTVAHGVTSTLNFSGINVDRVELTSADFFYITFDNFSACITPAPSFTVGPACAGLATSFTDASAGVASEASYAWDFDNNGITDNTTKGNVSYTYTTTGVFTAKLTITQGGCSNSYTQSVTVGNSTASPVINTPVCPGAISISGTSSEADGTAVMVYNGSTQIGTATVGLGTWTASVTAVTAGSSITAKATAAGKCPSTASTAVIVAGVATTTSVASSNNPSFTTAPDNLVTFTASVTSNGSVLTTGTATFTNGATVLGTTNLNSSGQAAITTGFSSEGNHIITATFNEACPYAASNGSVTQVVSNHTTVTGTTYCNNASGITINDNTIAAPYPSNIYVSGLTGSVTKLTVSINGFTHGFTGNVDVLLVGPGNRELVLLSNVGNTAVSNVNLTLDDAAASQMPLGGALASGTFRPTAYAPVLAFASPAPTLAVGDLAAPAGTGTLALFNNIDPNGTWSLYVRDHLTGNTGSISSWCLNITSCQITCPSTVTAYTGPANTNCGALVSYPAATSSGCGSLTYSKSSGSFFPVGETTVRVTSTTSQSCQFTVNVIDNTPPTFSGVPANVTVSCSANVPSPATVTATDNCSGSVNVSYSQTTTPGDCADRYSLLRTWTTTDNNGNGATAQQSIVVVDNTPPTFQGVPANVTVACNAVPAPANVTATDNCSGSVAAILSTATIPGNCADRYTLLRTWTATDNCGNTNTVQQSVVVVDNAAPVFSGVPANVTVTCNAVPPPATVTATDNCTPDINVTLNATTIPGNCADRYTLLRTWTATDNCGNTNTVQQSVVVVDNVAPTITSPANVTVEASATSCNVTLNPTPPAATDNCSPTTAIVLTPSGVPASNSFPLGTTTITWTATDRCGNSSTASQTIEVRDVTPPVISSISTTPSSLWPPDHTMRDVAVAYDAIDNCGGSVISSLSVTSNEAIHGTADNDREPDWEIIDAHHVRLRAERGNSREQWVYTITITSTDARGNTGRDSIKVIVAHNITGPVTGKPFRVGSTVAFSGVFWDKPGMKHTAQWVIDDNTTVKGTVTEPSGMKNGKVAGSYKFTTAGVYRLQMNITDQNRVTSYCNTNEDMEAIIVIYDPNGGYTYGGGWFPSPAGALKSDPAVTGKASFGYSINYYKSATYPKGETQFEFKVGDLQYNALNFDYLAIQGAWAQFKGSGRIIGGQSGINFIMTVVDGSLDGSGVDKVRLKIYNKNTGEVYYDSQPGASDTDDPLTSVGVNSDIVIGGGTMLTRRMDPAGISVTPENTLEVKASPNPTSTSFIISISSSNLTDPITLTATDLLGRIVEVKTVGARQVIRMGDRYRPGLYMIRVLQGMEHRELKLVKLLN
jgi:subtilisin-like proprotein convertase family protein